MEIHETYLLSQDKRAELAFGDLFRPAKRFVTFIIAKWGSL